MEVRVRKTVQRREALLVQRNMHAAIGIDPLDSRERQHALAAEGEPVLHHQIGHRVRAGIDDHPMDFAELARPADDVCAHLYLHSIPPLVTPAVRTTARRRATRHTPVRHD